MKSIITKEQIIQFLPHGVELIGIDAIVEITELSIVALSTVGNTEFMIDKNRGFIQEASLELVGQAAILGRCLSGYNADAKMRQGVIAKLETLEMYSATRPVSGDVLRIEVEWSQPIGLAYQITGYVRTMKDNALQAKVECTVLEVP